MDDLIEAALEGVRLDDSQARALGEFGPLLIFAGATRNKTEVLSTTVFLELSIRIGETHAQVQVLGDRSLHLELDSLRLGLARVEHRAVEQTQRADLNLEVIPVDKEGGRVSRHPAVGPGFDGIEQVPNQLLGRFIDVCDAIQYAHSRGVLHRDLKPGNIILGSETLKLLGHPDLIERIGDIVTAPEIEVLDGATNISDGGTVNFGVTAANTAVDKQLTVRNTGDEVLTLTPVEFDILESLMRSKGRVKSREQLVEETADRNYVAFDRSVDVHVSSLRKKLRDDPKSPHFIKTIRAVGYLFIDPERES